MLGAHAARAALLIIGCGFTQWEAAGQDVELARQDVDSNPLMELGTAAMPRGMVSLCERDASFCAPAGPAPQFLVLTATNLALLAKVNRGVNHAIVSTTDRQLYGRDEYWTIPTTAGDCEDYVLLKRQMLMAGGIGEAALLITVVHDENGDGHAVLTVPTREGDLVLDNRRDEILHWWQTGYSFIKRQSEFDPEKWVSLGPDRLQTTDIASGPGVP